MATQEQDTFATGGRGAGTTIAAINPASNGDTWTSLSGGSTYSFSGSRASLTGSNVANIVTLQGSVGKQWFSSVVVARFSKTATADSCGVAARVQNSSNFYHARVANGNLIISKVKGGTSSDLATVACGFTDSPGLFWVKLYLQGFGMNGGYQNLQAKAWVDGTSEPATYQVSASDGTLTTYGGVGFRIKGNAGANTQTIDSFSAVDTGAWLVPPTYATYQDLPIGITSYFNQNQYTPLDQQVISDLQGWGNGVYNREQIQWAAIEWLQAVPGFYTWDQLDDLVYRCNVAGIRICACIQGAPSWYLTIKAADGSVIGTVGTGGGDLPDPTSYAAFAQALVTRYNGKNGFGFVEMYQLFNEELDANSYPNSPGINRDVLGSRLATYVNLAYPLIQAASPTAEIAVGAVRKTPTLALQHIINWETNFFTGLNKSIQNLRRDAHFYCDGSFSSDPTAQNVDRPSASTEAWTILNVAQRLGFPNVTLMFGEFGFNYYDDSSGVTGTTNGAITGGTPITSLPLTGLSAAIPDATPITVDYGNATFANQEIVYAYGQIGKNNGNPTTGQITTNPLGSGAAQASWTPKASHGSGVAIYGATLTVNTPGTILKYHQSMYDVMRQFPRAKCFLFTLVNNSVVDTTKNPFTVGAVGAPKSVTQVLNGVYTYMPAYFMAQEYMRNILLKPWTPAPQFRQSTVIAPALSSTLTADALSATVTAPTP
jgi:hypothetical protein